MPASHSGPPPPRWHQCVLVRAQAERKEGLDLLFSKWDTDGSGTISFEEFSAMLPGVGVKSSKTEMQVLE